MDDFHAVIFITDIYFITSVWVNCGEFYKIIKINRMYNETLICVFYSSYSLLVSLFLGCFLSECSTHIFCLSLFLHAEYSQLNLVDKKIGQVCFRAGKWPISPELHKGFNR